MTDLKADSVTEVTELGGEEKMFVYANLGKMSDSESEWDPRQRVELLRIRHDGHGHYWFKPDLTGGRPAYQITSSSALNCQWRYKIEGIQVGPVQGKF